MVAADNTTNYKLITFVPISHTDAVKTAVFATGACTIGLYDCVCFSSVGTGEFVPNKDASPHIGTPGQREEVKEVRLEFRCRGREEVKKAVAGVKG